MDYKEKNQSLSWFVDFPADEVLDSIFDFSLDTLNHLSNGGDTVVPNTRVPSFPYVVNQTNYHSVSHFSSESSLWTFGPSLGELRSAWSILDANPIQILFTTFRTEITIIEEVIYGFRSSATDSTGTVNAYAKVRQSCSSFELILQSQPQFKHVFWNCESIPDIIMPMYLVSCLTQFGVHILDGEP